MRSLMKKFSQSAPTSCRIASGAKFNLKIGLIQNLYGIFWITIQNLYIIFWISPQKASEKKRSVNKSTSRFRFSSIDVSTTLVGTCLRHVITNQRDGSFGLWFAWNQTCRSTNDRCEALASLKGGFLCFCFSPPVFFYWSHTCLHTSNS